MKYVYTKRHREGNYLTPAEREVMEMTTLQAKKFAESKGMKRVGDIYTYEKQTRWYTYRLFTINE